MLISKTRVNLFLLLVISAPDINTLRQDLSSLLCRKSSGLFFSTGPQSTCDPWHLWRSQCELLLFEVIIFLTIDSRAWQPWQSQVHEVSICQYVMYVHWANMDSLIGRMDVRVSWKCYNLGLPAGKVYSDRQDNWTVPMGGNQAPAVYRKIPVYRDWTQIPIPGFLKKIPSKMEVASPP